MVRQSAAFVVLLTLAVPAAALAQAPPPPVRVGGLIKPPMKIYDVKPVYPAIARAAGVQGVVIMELTLSPTGTVDTAKVLKSIPLLDQAALDAVYQWQFTPTELNGVPTAIIYTVTVSFALPASNSTEPAPATLATPEPAPAPSPAAAQTPAPVNALSVADNLQPAPNTEVRVGGAIKPPAKTRDVPPVYPAIAVAARKEGVVIVQVHIATDGTVSDVTILRSVPLLDQAAIDAVKQWTFAPTLVNGVPTAIIYTITVPFSLPRQQ